MYSIYKFNDGSYLPSRKSISYFRPETGPELVATNIATFEQAHTIASAYEAYNNKPKKLGNIERAFINAQIDDMEDLNSCYYDNI